MNSLLNDDYLHKIIIDAHLKSVYFKQFNKSKAPFLEFTSRLGSGVTNLTDSNRALSNRTRKGQGQVLSIFDENEMTYDNPRDEKLWSV
jgi:hypothetical protein